MEGLNGDYLILLSSPKHWLSYVIQIASITEMIFSFFAVKVKTVGKFYIANGGLPNVYKTAQLHFHWGLEDDQGSEHQIDSASYPMEVSIQNDMHGNICKILLIFTGSNHEK